MRCLSWYIHLLLGLRIDCISRGGSEHSLALWGKTLHPLRFEFVLVLTLDIVGLVCVCVHSVYYLVRGEVHWTGVSYIQMIGTTHFVLFLYLAVFRGNSISSPLELAPMSVMGARELIDLCKWLSSLFLRISWRHTQESYWLFIAIVHNHCWRVWPYKRFVYCFPLLALLGHMQRFFIVRCWHD